MSQSLHSPKRRPGQRLFNIVNPVDWATNLFPRNSSGELTARVLHRTRNPASSRGGRRRRPRMDTHTAPTSPDDHVDIDTASVPDLVLSSSAPGVLADNDVAFDPSLPPQTTERETLPPPIQSMVSNNTNTNTSSARERESTGTPPPQRDDMDYHSLMGRRTSSRKPTGRRYKLGAAR